MRSHKNASAFLSRLVMWMEDEEELSAHSVRVLPHDVVRVERSKAKSEARNVSFHIYDGKKYSMPELDGKIWDDYPKADLN